MRRSAEVAATSSEVTHIPGLSACPWIKEDTTQWNCERPVMRMAAIPRNQGNHPHGLPKGSPILFCAENGGNPVLRTASLLHAEARLTEWAQLAFAFEFSGEHETAPGSAG